MRRRKPDVDSFEPPTFEDDFALPFAARMERFERWEREYEAVAARAADAGVTVDIPVVDAPFDPYTNGL